MPACVNTFSFFVCLSLLLLPGCGDRNGSFGFELKGMEARVSGQQLNVELTQKIILSPDARAALENGVALHLEVRAELETQTDTITGFRQFEIRYMPLSNHYQLSSDQATSVRTFQRLRHVLAALSKIELVMPLENVVAGDYPLNARSWLEKSKLPAPMRLPAWFSPDWRLDSGWKSWSVHIAASQA